jgi:segregation and condensation protein B
MSLKAKIEAVIYASEEPITLAQLTGLLGDEAQAELDALTATQLPLDTDASPSDDADALNAEVMDTSEVDSTTPATDAVILSEELRDESKDPEEASPASTAETLSKKEASDAKLASPPPPRLPPLAPRPAHRRLRLQRSRPRDP